jgi:hypothetical protein
MNTAETPIPRMQPVFCTATRTGRLQQQVSDLQQTVNALHIEINAYKNILRKV